MTATTKDCEELYYLSLTEVTHSFGVTAATIVDIVEEGIVSVQKNQFDEWSFDQEALNNIRIVLQLHRDLGINMAGAALALELLKEIDRLK